MREARSTHSKGGDKLVRREGEGQVFVKMGIISIDSFLICGVWSLILTRFVQHFAPPSPL